MFTESFKGVSRKFQGNFKKVSRVCVKYVLKNFQGCFMKVLMLFQKSLRSVSRQFSWLKGSFREASEVLYGISKVFQESF